MSVAQDSQTKRDRLLSVAKRRGAIRPKELEELGIARTYLERLCREGELKKVARGLYVLSDAQPTENRSLAEVSIKVPAGVVCLLSALRFHDLTTQAPYEVWLALDRKARKPRIDELPVRIVRFSGDALNEGIEEHNVEGVNVRIYCPAKTVADCFKYRNKIGLDVAIEALRDCRRHMKCSADDLWRYARICRVWKVLQPYMEALT